MLPPVQDGRRGQELPRLELNVLVLALPAVLVIWAIVGNVNLQGGVEVLELDVVLLDVHHHVAGQQTPVVLVVVRAEHNRRAL